MSLAKRIADRQRASRKVIEVAEWGEDGEPMLIHCGPMLAIEMDKIQRKHPNFFQAATIAGMVDLVIMKAEDKDGEKLFSLDDKPVLMREEFGIVARVAGEMISSTSIEEQEKN